MSENVQLEQLLAEKSSVENEGNQLDEEQRQLKLRAKVLTEKIIQELKKRNNAKQENVNKLRFDVNDLESQLNALKDSTVLGDSGERTEDTAEAVAASKEEPKETVEETIASSEELNIVSVTEVAQETDTNSTTKKKRKYF